MRLRRNPNWPILKVKEWLEANPIIDNMDLTFLISEEAEFRSATTEATLEILNEEVDKLGRWKDNTPFLQLYHSLAEDNIKTAFAKRHEIMGKEDLDPSRQDPDRPKTWEALVAEKFNDPEYVVRTLALPELHDNFTESTVIRLEDCPGEISSDQAKTRLADTKTKAILVINSWEKSGNGADQHIHEEDKDFGTSWKSPS